MVRRGPKDKHNVDPKARPALPANPEAFASQGREIDGGQHSRNEAAARDFARDTALWALGFRVQRYWNANLDGVVETILAHARRG